MLDCVAVVGLIAVAEIICDVSPALAASLNLLPFKLDLTAIASILTILGYSINDKIVVLDRIRENRGKLTYASRDVINQSINQTMSRTLMTGTTTILSTLILYLIGGEAVRSFAYTLGLGVVIGTISSVVLGAPMVWSSKLDEAAEPDGTAPAAA
jgi:preprotein translocase SecF subunit